MATGQTEHRQALPGNLRTARDAGAAVDGPSSTAIRSHEHSGSTLLRRLIRRLIGSAPQRTHFGADLVNDVHSRLNETHIHHVVYPDSIEAVQALVRNAKAEGLAVSVAGGRHAMGRQQFGAGTVLCDMTDMDRVLSFDRGRGLIELEAEIRWPELLRYLVRAHKGSRCRWGIRQKQTGVDRLGIGGALSGPAPNNKALPPRRRPAMRRQISLLSALALVALLLQGCSVGMAMSGKKTPELGAVRTGATRGEIELQLGSPVKTVTNADGTRDDLYKYEVGNDPSAGRAAFHGVMDVLTLGLWEVAGTPIEALQGESHQLIIHYSADDRVLSVNAPPPAPVDGAEAKASTHADPAKP